MSNEHAKHGSGSSAGYVASVDIAELVDRLVEASGGAGDMRLRFLRVLQQSQNEWGMATVGGESVGETLQRLAGRLRSIYQIDGEPDIDDWKDWLRECGERLANSQG